MFDVHVPVFSPYMVAVPLQPAHIGSALHRQNADILCLGSTFLGEWKLKYEWARQKGS